MVKLGSDIPAPLPWITVSDVFKTIFFELTDPDFRERMDLVLPYVPVDARVYWISWWVCENVSDWGYLSGENSVSGLSDNRNFQCADPTASQNECFHLLEGRFGTGTDKNNFLGLPEIHDRHAVVPKNEVLTLLRKLGCLDLKLDQNFERSANKAYAILASIGYLYGHNCQGFTTNHVNQLTGIKLAVGPQTEVMCQIRDKYPELPKGGRPPDADKEKHYQRIADSYYSLRIDNKQ